MAAFAVGPLLLAPGTSNAFQAATAEAPKTETSKSQDPRLDQVTFDIKYLASDEMGGRQPGTPGIELAEEYIVQEYKKAGLTPPQGSDNYLQAMEVGNERTVIKEKSVLTVSGPNDEKMELELNSDFVNLVNRNDYSIEKPIVFVGYGINAKEHNFNEFKDVDVEDSIVLMIRREPQQGNEDSVFDGTETSRFAYIRTKVRQMRSAGVAGIIMVNDGYSSTNSDELVEADQFGTTTQRIPFSHVKRSVIDKLLAKTPVRKADGSELSSLKDIEACIDETLEPLSQPMEGWTAKMEAGFKTKAIKTNNIVGVVEGEGPNADETIVIGAHYDHLGMGAYGSRAGGRKEVHNGADDNATGTAAVIELARRFATADKKPSRRLVFICFTAEEMGLLGARHYVENPLYPLEKTVAMVNFDMIGWLRNDELTVFNWNSSSAFAPVLDEANLEMKLNLKKPVSGFAGSDHLPFFQRQIPVMFLHTGLTDTYHTPEDDFETIDCGGACKVINFTEKVVEGIANLGEAPAFGTPKPVRLGVILKTEGDVVSIEAVTEESIATRSGLLAGDVILAIGDETITKRRQVTRVIRRDSGKTIPFKIKRDDVEMTLNVTLKREVDLKP